MNLELFYFSRSFKSSVMHYFFNEIIITFIKIHFYNKQRPNWKGLADQTFWLVFDTYVCSNSSVSFMIIRLSEMENADVWAGFLNHRNAFFQLGLEMFIETLNFHNWSWIWYRITELIHNDITFYILLSNQN
jgi:hypothetical protein